MLIRNGHEAMIEHSFLSVKFTVDRGVSHELVRHRIASFARKVPVTVIMQRISSEQNVHS